MKPLFTTTAARVIQDSNWSRRGNHHMPSYPRPAWTRLASVWPGQWRGCDAPWAFELVIVSSMLLLVAAATPIGSHLGSMSPHPLWILVLLLSSQYGTMPGLAAAVAAMAVHWLAGAPPQAGGEDIYDYLYRVWREPMLWPVAAVVLGGFRGQHAQKTEALRVRLAETDIQLRTIGGYAEGLRSHCESLERRIACAADRSIEAGLAALEDVRLAGRDELKCALPRTMELLVGSARYQVLTLRDGHLSIDTELSSITEETCRLPRIERLPALLEAELVRGHRLLSIRKADAAGQLAGTALIASPIISPSADRLIGAILIQAMDPMKLTEATERGLHALCRELAHSLSRDRVVCNFTRAWPPARLVASAGGVSPTP